MSDSEPLPTSTVRVLVADDHSIVRTGLRALFRRHSDLLLVGEASTAADMLSKARELAVHVVVADLNMPGGGTIKAIRELRDLRDAPQVVVFTGFDSSVGVLLAFKAGASGYVVKGSPPKEVLTAVRCVAAGARYLDPLLDEALIRKIDEEGAVQPGAFPLSAREAQVLEMTALGYTNKEMAASLGIGVKSVETYRYRATGKLGIKSRAELTEYVRNSGVLDTEGTRRIKAKT